MISISFSFQVSRHESSKQYFSIVQMLFKCFTPCCATHTRDPLGAIARLTLAFSPPVPEVPYIGRIGIFVALRACNWQFHIQLCSPPADTFEGG